MKALWDRSIGAVGDSAREGVAQAAGFGQGRLPVCCGRVGMVGRTWSRGSGAMTGLCESQYGAGPVETAMR